MTADEHLERITADLDAQVELAVGFAVESRITMGDAVRFFRLFADFNPAALD